MREFFEEIVSQLGRRIQEGDHFGCYNHLNGVDVEGKRIFKLQYMRDEEGRLLRDIGLIPERWVRWFHIVLNTKSSTLDPTLVEKLEVWPSLSPLDNVPPSYEVEFALGSFYEIIVALLRGGVLPQHWKDEGAAQEEREDGVW